MNENLIGFILNRKENMYKLRLNFLLRHNFYWYLLNGTFMVFSTDMRSSFLSCSFSSTMAFISSLIAFRSSKKCFSIANMIPFCEKKLA